MNLKNTPGIVILSVIFALGIIIFSVSGTNGYKETMNWVSYTGLGISFSCILYIMFGWIFNTKK